MTSSNGHLRRFRLLLNDPIIRQNSSKLSTQNPEVLFGQIFLSKSSQQENPNLRSMHPRSEQQKSVLRKEADQTIGRIEEFCSKIKSIENLTMSLKKRLDSGMNTLTNDEKTLETLVDEMHDKLGKVDTVLNLVDDVEERLAGVVSRYERINSTDLQSPIDMYRPEYYTMRSPTKSKPEEFNQTMNELLIERALNSKLKIEMEDERRKCLEERRRCDEERKKCEEARYKYEEERRKYEEEKKKCAILVIENNLLVNENKRFEGELGRYRIQQGDEKSHIQSLYDQNLAASKQIEILQGRVNSLEKENSDSKDREIISNQEKFVLEERLKSLLTKGETFERSYKNILDPQRSRSGDEDKDELLLRIKSLEKENQEIKENAKEAFRAKKSLDDKIRAIRPLERSPKNSFNQGTRNEGFRDREGVGQAPIFIQDSQSNAQKRTTWDQNPNGMTQSGRKIRNPNQDRPVSPISPNRNLNQLNEFTKSIVRDIYTRDNELAKQTRSTKFPFFTPIKATRRDSDRTELEFKDVNDRAFGAEAPASRSTGKIFSTEKQVNTVTTQESEKAMNDRTETFGDSSSPGNFNNIEYNGANNSNLKTYAPSSFKHNRNASAHNPVQPYIDIKRLSESKFADVGGSPNIKSFPLRSQYIDINELSNSRGQGERSLSPHIKTFDLKEKRV